MFVKLKPIDKNMEKKIIKNGGVLVEDNCYIFLVDDNEVMPLLEKLLSIDENLEEYNYGKELPFSYYYDYNTQHFIIKYE